MPQKEYAARGVTTESNTRIARSEESREYITEEMTNSKYLAFN